MNIVCSTDNFNTQNLFFSIPKRNIIMDGIFTKIMYSNEFVTINQIYLHIHFQSPFINKFMNNYFIYFNTMHNTKMIKDLIDFETLVLKQYIANFNQSCNQPTDTHSSIEKKTSIQYHRDVAYPHSPKCNIEKQPLFLLKEQLLSGNVKLYRESNVPTSTSTSTTICGTKPLSHTVLKISGVWENEKHIGLTYKFIETSII